VAGPTSVPLGARVRGYLAPLLAGSPAWAALLDAPVAIGVYRRDGTLLLLNQAALDLFGHPLALILERGWIALSQPEAREQEQTRANLAEQFDSRGTTRHRRTVQFADGSTRLVELTSTKVTLPDGEVAVMSTVVEPSGVRTPEAGGERGLRELVEDAPDVLARLEVASGRVSYVNRAVERFTGYLPDAFYQDAGLFARCIAPDSRAAWEGALTQVRKGDSRQFDLALVHRDGREAVLSQSLYPIRDALGEVRWIEGSARDITTVRQLEQLKARNEERSSLERLKSQLLANVSHELRTPMVSIKGYNDLLLRGALGPLTPRQRRGLEIAGANTERLIELIETLLDFARREEERLELTIERFDLRLAVEDAVGLLRERIASRNLTLRVSLGPKPIEIKGDRARLSQVFRALIGNAEKFTEGLDAAAGTSGEIRIELLTDGKEVEIAVSDSGIGIPVDLHDKIFDRFYQVDASSPRRFGGAGLGLALARELVTLHGGRIKVASQEGRGSTFSVTLPLPTSDSGKYQPIAPPRPVVLVGADEPTWQALRPTLEAGRLGPLDVFPAHSEADVLRRARRHRPDLVVIAFEDPDLLVDELKRGAETATLPVVVVTPEGHRPVGRADLVAAASETTRLVAGLSRLLHRGARPDQPGRPPQVVIVEDEIEILDFTRFVLEREGYEVVCLQTGQEALAAVTAATGLVILDIALEGDDGIEVCRELRARPDTHEVPILIMTAMSGDEIRRVSMAAGAVGYLVKPFGVDEFLRLVRLYLRATPNPSPERAKPPAETA